MTDPIPLFPGQPGISAAKAGLRRFEDLVNRIDAIVWEADPSTFRFSFVSAAAERMLGYPVADWYQDGFWPDHIHPEDRERAVQFCLEQSAGGLDHCFEYRMIGQQGQEVWLRDSVSVDMHKGVPLRLRGVMVDVTAEKRARRALSEQFHFLWQLVDAIPSPIFWKDAQGCYGGCNEAFEAYIGIKREALIGKSVFDIAPPDLAQVYAAADQDLFDRRGTQVYEADVKYADGSRHSVVFYKATFTRQNNELGGLVGIMLDITDRKGLETELAEQHALLKTVVDSIVNGISLVDANLDLVLCNSRARTIMDLPDSLFAAGKVPLEQIFRFNADRGEYGPGDPEEQVRAYVERAKTFQPHRFERVRPDGTVIDISGEPIAGGGFVTIYRDITAERQAEMALTRQSAFLNSVLEHLPQGISVFDEHLRLKHWNRGFIDVLGLPPEMVVEDMHFDELARIPAERGEYGPGDPEKHVARLHALAVQFQAHQFERTRPSGKTHLVCGRPIISDGRIHGFVTTYTDISDRRSAEEALRLSATVFEKSAEGIVLTDQRGRILRTNRAFQAITGYSEEEAMGKSPGEVLKSEGQDRDFYVRMWEALNRQGHWSGEIVNRRKSGELFTELLSITRVDDAQGRPTNYIGIFSDLTDAKNAEQRIEQLSYFDILTGLPNRAMLTRRLDQAVGQCRDGQVAGLLTIDIGGLAHINDTLGHHFGDKLLLAIAQRLMESTPANTTLCRHAGDGFAVVAVGLEKPEAAGTLAADLLEALHQPFELEGHPLAINAHIGISLCPADGEDPATLLKNADAALHHARNEGINGYEYFRQEMNTAAMERLLIETRLRQGLRQGELLLHYQPQIDLVSGAIIGMEALVRWSHPDIGLVSPTRFIPVAESSGLIVELGNWVLGEACRAAQAMRATGHPELRVAVNVSARQFNHEDFADQVRVALAASGLPPQCLELELTESLIMQRPQQVVRTMEALKTLGVTFSIDDFGTGYSSLSQLLRFPIDKLKIDQSFIHDISNSAEGSVITRAVIALGHSLRLNVIAEGVETEEQKRFVLQNGCHAAQGYLFSRPLPEAAMAKLLQDPRGCRPRDGADFAI